MLQKELCAFSKLNLSCRVHKCRYDSQEEESRREPIRGANKTSTTARMKEHPSTAQLEIHQPNVSLLWGIMGDERGYPLATAMISTTFLFSLRCCILASRIVSSSTQADKWKFIIAFVRPASQHPYRCEKI